MNKAAVDFTLITKTDNGTIDRSTFSLLPQFEWLNHALKVARLKFPTFSFRKTVALIRPQYVQHE